MAVTLTIAGTSYTYPNGIDKEWGASTTTAMHAVCSNAIWKDGSVALTADWDVGDYALTMKTITLDVADGTAPMNVTSTTKVANLQAGSVEGTNVLSTGETGGTKFLRENGDGSCSWQTAAGGGGTGSTEPNPQYAAGSFDYPSSNPAPLDTDTTSSTGVITTIKRHLFDDTTNESVVGQFKVPSDIDATDTVTFRLIGYPSTAAASNVVFTFMHSATAGYWDSGGQEVSSGAKTCSAIQDTLSFFTWTETVSNLGWLANDFCRFQLTRDSESGSDTLSGDYGVVYFEIDIPRA